MAKHILAFPEDMGPVEREINQSKYDRLTDGDVRSDHQILAGHLDKVNARLDELVVAYGTTLADAHGNNCVCDECFVEADKGD